MSFIIIPASFRVFEMKLQYLRYPALDQYETAWDLEEIYVDVTAATEAANAATAAAELAASAADAATEAVNALAPQVVDNTAAIISLGADILTVTGTADAAQVAADAAQADADAAMAAATGASGANGKIDYFVAFGDQFTWLAGTKLVSITDLAPYNLFVGSTTNNARATFGVPLRAGTWTFWVMTARRADAANLLLKIDGASAIAGHNLYKAAPPDYLYITSVAGVTVLNKPIIDIEVWADGHTNPSSGYVMTLTKVWGIRTGA